jgi:hypothetical protein
MYDYLLSFVWWFMWTPLYIQAACILLALLLVGMPLVTNLEFHDIMACLCMLGLLVFLCA